MSSLKDKKKCFFIYIQFIYFLRHTGLYCNVNYIIIINNFCSRLNLTRKFEIKKKSLTVVVAIQNGMKSEIESHNLKKKPNQRLPKLDSVHQHKEKYKYFFGCCSHLAKLRYKVYSNLFFVSTI